MQPKVHSTRKKALLSLAALLCALLVCEILLRVYDVRYRPMKIDVDGVQTDWRFDHSFKDEHFVYDPKLIWRPKKSYSVFNAQGFRGEDLPEQKRSDEYRIFAIGDSNTLGWTGDNDNQGANWPADLQKILTEQVDPMSVSTKPGNRYSVTNAGVWGYSSFQGRQRLPEILALQPDMVMISFGSNDALLVVVPDADFTATFFESVIGTTRIGQLILQFWDNMAAGGKDVDEQQLVHRVSVDEYRDNLREIISICKANEVECVLLTRPFIGDSSAHLNPERWWKHFAPQYVDATLEVARQNDVLAVDVYSRFKDEEDLFADESHFTELGHRLAAEFIYEQIKPRLPQ